MILEARTVYCPPTTPEEEYYNSHPIKSARYIEANEGINVENGSLSFKPEGDTKVKVQLYVNQGKRIDMFDENGNPIEKMNEFFLSEDGLKAVILKSYWNGFGVTRTGKRISIATEDQAIMAEKMFPPQELEAEAALVIPGD